MVSGGGEGWETLNGLTLHYLLWGSGPQPPILLLHAATGQAAEFEPLAVELAQNRRVFALDLRGHGASDWAPDGDYSLGAYLGDLDAFLSYLELDGIWLLGSSLGAGIAIAAAARRPERAARLLLDDQPPELPPAHMIAPFLKTLETLDRPFASPAEAMAARARVTGLRQSEQLLATTVANLRRDAEGAFRWRWDPEILRVFARGSVDLWPDFGRLTADTLCLRGANSRLLTRASWQRMQAMRPDLAYLEVPLAAHTVAVTAPTAFGSIVLDWATQRTQGRS
jgi:pimeloyl-ACP methyl ester carboxylesterase